MHAKKSTTSSEEKQEIDLDKVLTTQFKIKSKTVRAMKDKSQRIPFIASLKVQDLENIKKAPSDIVCVIDNSGSMED